MYKDKDRQRKADKARQRRRRDKIKVEGVTEQGVTSIGVTPKLARIDKNQELHLGIETEPLGTPTLDEPLTDNTTAKRGKDIKCFEDLPPDVQQTINRMSIVDGRIDQTQKANRTAIAVHYQHLFPDRYYSTGVA